MAQGGDCLVILAGGGEGAAQLEVGLEVVGGEGDGALKLGDGFGVVLLDEEERAEVKVSGGEVGVEREGAVELRAGVGELVLLGEDGAQGVMERRRCWVPARAPGLVSCGRSSGSPVASRVRA